MGRFLVITLWMALPSIVVLCAQLIVDKSDKNKDLPISGQESKEQKISEMVRNVLYI